MNIEVLSPKVVCEKMCKGQAKRLLDVRTAAEFRRVRVPGSENVPLQELDPAKYMKSHQVAPSETVYILCKAGVRAQRAAEAFVAAGFKNVAVVEGGIVKWEAEGLPVEKTSVLSIEQQVRLGVGSMILLGTVLGAFVHPAFLVVPAFMGCGLIVAGFRGKCPLESMLTRMPWNRTAPQVSCCQPQAN
ncbi:MAG: rhodanese-like domain-containing protein [Candidatus Sumerlaea chitinivorans]|nr:rhodanese-like domain-containing protein [Candidatus Sumerlaea chitinivorans]